MFIRNRYLKVLTLLALGICFTSNLAFGCTSIAFSGKAVQKGGTIIAKNRDAGLNGQQRLELIKPAGKHAYVALVYNVTTHSKSYPYITSGTNDTGLTIVTNDAATNLPPNEDQIETDVITNVLTNYSSVAMVKKDTKKIFGTSKPALYIITDHHQTMNIEVGDNGHYSQHIVSNGYTWNTNLYHLGTLANENKKLKAALKTRTKMVKRMLKNIQQPTDVYHLLSILNNQDHGEFSSIQRMLTVAKYVVITPNNHTPTLMVTMMMPGQSYDRYTVTLDQSFFNNQPAGLLNAKQYGLLSAQNKKRIDKYLARFDT